MSTEYNITYSDGKYEDLFKDNNIIEIDINLLDDSFYRKGGLRNNAKLNLDNLKNNIKSGIKYTILVDTDLKIISEYRKYLAFKELKYKTVKVKLVNENRDNLKIKHYEKLRKNIVRKIESDSNKKKITSKYNNTCYICGRKCESKEMSYTRNKLGLPRSELAATIDHFIAHSKGGENNEDNYRLCCNFCNALKGSSRYTDNLAKYIKNSAIKRIYPVLYSYNPDNIRYSWANIKYINVDEQIISKHIDDKDECKALASILKQLSNNKTTKNIRYKKDLKEFPLVVDKNYNLVLGYGLYKVYKSYKTKSVNIIVVEKNKSLSYRENLDKVYAESDGICTICGCKCNEITEKSYSYKNNIKIIPDVLREDTDIQKFNEPVVINTSNDKISLKLACTFCANSLGYYSYSPELAQKVKLLHNKIFKN